MKKSFGLALVFVATSVFAQSLSEKIEVSLVNVDVTVSSHGAPARGLTRDDFQVFEDGVARPITNFYAVEPATVALPGSKAPAASPDVSIADPTDERFRRKVLVIIDNRHVSMFNRDRALAALERFVDDRFTGGSYDWSIALISDTARIVLPLTSDKAKLHAAVAEIRKIAANPQRYTREDTTPIASADSFSGSNHSAVKAAETGLLPETHETATTLTDLGANSQFEADSARTAFSIRDAVRSFAGVQGRKIILLVTGSLGLDPGFSPLDANPFSYLSGPANISQSLQSSTSMRDYLIREANASNVSFFILNSEGLTPNSDAAGRDDSSLVYANPNQLAAMYWLARETGGRLMPGNSPDLSLAEFDRASSSFYSLAYKPAHGDDGKYHSIKVRIKSSGYQLQYRTGYSSIPAALQLARAMNSSLATSMQQSSIPVNIATGQSTPHDGGILVPLRSSVAAKDLQFLPAGNGSVARVDLFVSIFDDRGQRIVSTRSSREAHADAGTESRGDFVDTRQILIKRGVPYRVVVAVHDQVTDAIGISSKTVRF
jgi:VWFA-related protein